MFTRQKTKNAEIDVLISIKNGKFRMPLDWYEV